jgi:nucleoside-diphosphate-sugar epimerase
VKCLVSGATGFIGRHLCQELLARGETVIALSKGGAALPDATPTLALDLARTLPRPELLQGVDVVFHLAGIAHRKAPASAYRALNERATLQLARLAAGAGVRCFVFLSSVKAMGPASDDRERSEGECTAPLDPYSQSKRNAEDALRAEFAHGPMAVVILRPALVYGPAAKGNLALLAGAVRAGLPRPPPLGARSMVAVSDLVNLLCIVSRAAKPGVQTWIASDGQRYSTRFICDQLRLAVGRGVGLAWLPTVCWRLAARLLDSFGPGSDDESTFDKLFGTELYSNRAVLAATSWRPHSRFPEIARQWMAAQAGTQ